MKTRLLTLSLGLGLLATGLIAGESGQSYLKATKPVEFQKPTGTNTPQIDALADAKTVPYGYDLERQIKSIHLLDRLGDLKQFPCSNCHKPGVVPDHLITDEEDPHRRIDVIHGSVKEMSCVTCHSKQNAEKLRYFDEEVPLNQAPKLCATCHSTQYKDWLGGAHGKRVGQWAGMRVIQSCTQCHNPHETTFKTRQPAPAPKVNRLDHE